MGAIRFGLTLLRFSPTIPRRERVLWVGAVSLVRSGGYAENLMQRWNRAIVAACRRYPNMRVYDWAARAKAPWFINDGIHYTTPGYIARTHLIARALASAFPVKGPPSAGCVVR